MNIQDSSRRGIPAQPILNGYCGNYEPNMPKSMMNDPAFNYDSDVPVVSTTPPSQTTVSTGINTSTSGSSRFFDTGLLVGLFVPFILLVMA